MIFKIYCYYLEADKSRTIYPSSARKLFKNAWSESYNEPQVTKPHKWGRDIIAFFNKTCKPGERKRVFLGVEIVDSTIQTEHVWEKSCLVTQKGGYDTMRCKLCGITGKRYGLGQHGVVRDSKYSAEKYRFCKGEKS